MSPPVSVDELLARAGALRGYRLISGQHKGSVGQQVEALLGAAGGSGVDFPELGVELKVLPCRTGWRVAESTWVAMATPSQLQQESWPSSRVWSKLRCVLFVCCSQELQEVGPAFLWQPDSKDQAILRADWEDLADLVIDGFAEHISARRGRWLQLRPKAKNSSVTRGSGDDIRHPLGFYLRSGVTQALLNAALS